MGQPLGLVGRLLETPAQRYGRNLDDRQRGLDLVHQHAHEALVGLASLALVLQVPRLGGLLYFNVVHAVALDDLVEPEDQAKDHRQETDAQDIDLRDVPGKLQDTVHGQQYQQQQKVNDAGKNSQYPLLGHPLIEVPKE